MSFTRTITTHNNKSFQQKAREINERRRQEQAFLRRNSDQNKQPVKDQDNSGPATNDNDTGHIEWCSNDVAVSVSVLDI